MRNIFKTSGKKVGSRNHSTGKKRTILVKEILDTDEDRVINQYNIYRNYITRFKGELLQRGTKLIGYRKRISA